MIAAAGLEYKCVTVYSHDTHICSYVDIEPGQGFTLGQGHV